MEWLSEDEIRNTDIRKQIREAFFLGVPSGKDETMKRLDDPNEYRKVMQFPLTFCIDAKTKNLELYEMRIVAKNDEQAEQAAKLLCDFLGLECNGVYEEDVFDEDIPDDNQPQSDSSSS